MVDKTMKPILAQKLSKFEWDLIAGYAARQKKLAIQTTMTPDELSINTLPLEDQKNGSEDGFLIAMKQLCQQLPTEKVRQTMRKALPIDDLILLLDHNPNLTTELRRILISYDIPIDTTNIFMPDHDQLDDLF